MTLQLFKFKVLDKHAMDILVNRRLYLSSWENLNDPHEAKMLVETPGLNYHMNPRRLKEEGILDNSPVARVCSLSSIWSSNLLWSHYAEGQSGIAIGLELTENLSDFEIIKVNYDNNIPTTVPPVDRNSILRALGHKSSEWSYEEEIRLVSFDENRRFVEGIKITDVIFGLRTNKSDIELVKKVINDNSIGFWQTCHKPGTYKLNRQDIYLGKHYLSTDTGESIYHEQTQ